LKLKQYQRLARLDKTNLDAVAAMVCEVFMLKPSRVNSMNAKCFAKYVKRLEQKEILTVPLFKSRRFITDAKKIRFGQFIEVAEWLKPKSELISIMHMVGASICKDFRTNHVDKSNDMLNMKANVVGYAVNKFIASYSALIESYSWLFSSDSDEKPHAFMRQFGWIYSAKSVAEHQGIKLDDAYELNVIEALNALSYIKGKGIYEDYLAKKK
jgi:hypothetical protein